MPEISIHLMKPETKNTNGPKPIVSSAGHGVSETVTDVY